MKNSLVVDCRGCLSSGLLLDSRTRGQSLSNDIVAFVVERN